MRKESVFIINFKIGASILFIKLRLMKSMLAPELISDELFEILNSLKNKDGKTSEFVLPRLAKWERGDQARELKFFLATIGIEPIRFHDLRASWCTMLLRKGVPIPQVISMGGWLELKTMRNYLRRSGVELDIVTNVLNLQKE